tara:strand:- start:107 stop:1768 length:1662 start_codon:yes stop_codon:yes gene_type:complete
MIIISIVIIGVPPILAESPVLIQTDKKEYSMGEDIILQGIVKFVNGKAVGIGLPENLDVAIEVYNSKNQLITSYVTDVKNDDTFGLKIKTGKNSSILINDKYFFVVYYGIATSQLLNSDFVGRYDVYVGVSALNPNTTINSISNNPIQDNRKSNPVISIPDPSPELKSEHWLLIGILGIASSLAIIIFKILGSLPKLPKDLEKTLNHNFKNISGDQFEELIAELYRKKGYVVKKTPIGPDQGVDLFLTKKRWVGQKRIIIQAKNWRDSVGNTDVLKTAGARQMHKASSAIVITSSHFTPSALKALNNTPHITGIEIEELKREFRKYFKTHTKKNEKKYTKKNEKKYTKKNEKKYTKKDQYSCSKCKKTFDRINLWLNSDQFEDFTCRECKSHERKVNQKSFKSKLRNFRNHQDYVKQKENIYLDKFRISDKEFDEIIEEFEQAHWSKISSEESQKHQKYIESLFRREFKQRKQDESKKNNEFHQEEIFDVSNLAIHYNLLGVSQYSTIKEIKDAYRKLILKWHPDRNPKEPKYAGKKVISIKIAYDEIMKYRQ